MNQRETFCEEISRLKQAKRRSKSHYLKMDYEKAIRRKQKQLALYDILQKKSIRREEHA